MNPNFQEIMNHLIELRDDVDASKKFREKTEHIITILRENSELAVPKALLELEELNSLEASPHHRTLVWDAMGMLESIKR